MAENISTIVRSDSSTMIKISILTCCTFYSGPSGPPRTAAPPQVAPIRSPGWARGTSEKLHRPQPAQENASSRCIYKYISIPSPRRRLSGGSRNMKRGATPVVPALPAAVRVRFTPSSPSDQPTPSGPVHRRKSSSGLLTVY